MTADADPREDIVNHIGAMRAFAVSLTRNTALADDVVQDALVKAWTNIEKFQPGTNMRAWLFTILRNTLYSHYRKTKREVEDGDGTLAGGLATKPDHDGRLQMGDFNAAFDQLGADQREALVLVGAGGYSYEDAADILGVATGTVKSRVNRARRRIVEILELDADDRLEATDEVTCGIVAAASQAA